VLEKMIPLSGVSSIRAILAANGKFPGKKQVEDRPTKRRFFPHYDALLTEMHLSLAVAGKHRYVGFNRHNVMGECTPTVSSLLVHG
jgi:hypothetical protein